MDAAQLAKIQQYLENHALALDIALFNFYSHGGSPRKVIDELKTYQNEDGGFRGSLEHDTRLPQSTAVATWTALRIMREVGIDTNEPVLRRALQFLADTYDPQRNGWAIVCPQVDDYPHAPWWSYKTAMDEFGWGNPSAELLGFVMKYNGPLDTKVLDALKHKALARVTEVDPSHFHEAFTFKGLYELADDDLRSKLKAPLETLIRKSANLKPGEWRSYSAPPLRFIDSPNDPFAFIFDKEIIATNIAFLIDSLVDDHWEPNWNWQGTYPEAWEVAKQEWCGTLTVKNLVILKRFGAIKSQCLPCLCCHFRLNEGMLTICQT